MNSRKIALKILIEIKDGAFSNIALDKYLSDVKDKRDRGLITEMVYGVIRLQNRLDFIIKDFSKIGIKKMDDVVILVLRLGLYQLLYLDRIPQSAAVNETVNAIKGMTNKGAVGFVNGLLRNFIRKQDSFSFPGPEDLKSYMVDYLSHPAWLVEYWQEYYGTEKTIELCTYNNQAADLFIRINTLKYSEEEFLTIYKKEDIELRSTNIPQTYMLKNSSSVENLPLFKEGGFIVQGLAASLAGHILNPLPGMKVLDMAAAPGGKTTHLADLMKNKGEIIALDIYDHKLELIKENCQRLGVKIVKTEKQDSSTYHVDDKFDMILLDAPCSGLGLIRQKPEIRWTKSKDDIQELAIIQMGMLENAINLLKKDGVLLYSTCTLTREENQDNIKKIINLYKEELRLKDIKEELSRLGLENKYTVMENGYLELFPSEDNTEGFFIAKLQKK